MSALTFAIPNISVPDGAALSAYTGIADLADGATAHIIALDQDFELVTSASALVADEVLASTDAARQWIRKYRMNCYRQAFSGIVTTQAIATRAYFSDSWPQAAFPQTVGYPVSRATRGKLRVHVTGNSSAGITTFAVRLNDAANTPVQLNVPALTLGIFIVEADFQVPLIEGTDVIDLVADNPGGAGQLFVGATLDLFTKAP